MNTSLILLAGGNGTRMHQPVPKQYLLLAGKPVIMHTLERIDLIDQISEVIIVCNEKYHSLLNGYISSYMLKKNYIFVEAGSTRQQSVYNGLQHVKSDTVMIHEAARPFVKKDDFEKLLSHPEENVTFAIDIPFTVLKAGEYVNEILVRKELINVQLPQKFNTASLKLGHEKALEDHSAFTEDASLLFHYGLGQIKVLRGNSYNIKITEPIDMLVGEIIYKEYFSRRD
jgi:2-C-methyl-D-erythritol 4-phosphate cytidylyltransferase